MKPRRTLKPRRTFGRLLLSALLLWLTTTCGDDATEPKPSLVGTWDFIGFSDAGVEAQTTGTAIFRSDGTFSIAGTITFPGGMSVDVNVDGTYEQSGNGVDLTIGEDISTWTLAFTGDRVVFTEVEAPPANTITLRRRQ